MTSAIPGNEFVADTVGIILRIERRMLGLTATSIFDAVEVGSVIVYVPAMVLAEILYTC